MEGGGPLVPELVTLAQANAAVAVLVVLGLLAAPVAALVARRRGGDPLLTGLMVGGPPVLVGLIWLVYNAVTDRLGLDRIVNLVVNLVLFVVVGVACGVGWSWLIACRQPFSGPAQSLALNVSRLPLETDLHLRFPVREPVLPGVDTNAAFLASNDGKFYVVHDERARANLTAAPDYLNQPRDLVGNFLTVLEFDTQAERNRYIADLESFIEAAKKRRRAEDKTNVSDAEQSRPNL